MFAYLPAAPDFESAAENRERESFFWKACGRIEGVACMSVSGAMRGAAAAPESGCCQVASGYHWNAEGHRVVAASLLDSLIEADLVSACRPSQTAARPESF